MKYIALLVLFIATATVFTPSGNNGRGDLVASQPLPRSCDSCGKPVTPPGVHFD